MKVLGVLCLLAAMVTLVVVAMPATGGDQTPAPRVVAMPPTGGDQTPAPRVVSVCEPNPCVNGTCTDDGAGSFRCSCADGYSGDNCETDINECADNPCVNGTCTDGVGGYTCSCDDGYSGDTCDTDACGTTDNCGAHGSCSGGDCVCADGYSGDNCETDINECADNPCVNGVCTDGPDSFICSCATGYGGTLCDEDIDECSAESQPCNENATCSNTAGSYTCDCNSGYAGDGRSCSVERCTWPESSDNNQTTYPEYSAIAQWGGSVGRQHIQMGDSSDEFESNVGAAVGTAVSEWTCAPGYNGNPSVSVCNSHDEPFTLSGCETNICSSQLEAGQNMGDVREYVNVHEGDLHADDSWSVNVGSCAQGYSSNGNVLRAARCSENEGEYTLSGCDPWTCENPFGVDGVDTTGYIQPDQGVWAQVLPDDPQSITCDTGYEADGARIEMCEAEGGPFILTGCLPEIRCRAGPVVPPALADKAQQEEVCSVYIGAGCTADHAGGPFGCVLGRDTDDPPAQQTCGQWSDWDDGRICSTGTTVPESADVHWIADSADKSCGDECDFLTCCKPSTDEDLWLGWGYGMRSAPAHWVIGNRNTNCAMVCDGTVDPDSDSGETLTCKDGLQSNWGAPYNLSGQRVGREDAILYAMYNSNRLRSSDANEPTEAQEDTPGIWTGSETRHGPEPIDIYAYYNYNPTEFCGATTDTVANSEAACADTGYCEGARNYETQCDTLFGGFCEANQAENEWARGKTPYVRPGLECGFPPRRGRGEAGGWPASCVGPTDATTSSHLWADAAAAPDPSRGIRRLCACKSA